MATLSPPVQNELQRQFNHELAAAHQYTALSLWCAGRNLSGFAAFFAQQAGEEREHAEKIIDHLLDRGLAPAMAGIPQPKADFPSLTEVAHMALAMEEANTSGINAAYEAAVSAKDYPAQVLLHWFINEQVEEEAWCHQMIDRVAGATCPGALANLDRHIVKLLTEGE